VALFIEKFDNSFIKITGPYDEKELLSSYFKKPSKNFQHTPLYKSGAWDGTIKFFNKSTSLLPYGLNQKLFDFLEESEIEFALSEELEDSLQPNDIFDFEELALKGFKGTFEPKVYQLEGAKKALLAGRGIIEHGTGAGKTFINYLIINYLIQKGYTKILFIVPLVSLIAQGLKDLKDYGLDLSLIGKYYGKEKDDSKIITLGTWQSLSKNKKLLNSVQCVFLDEAHGGKANEITKIMKECTNTKYRIGCTGSMPDWEADKFAIIGSFGPILDTVKTHQLIHKEKALSNLTVKVMNLHYPKDLKKTAKKYPDERDLIKSYEPRKKLVKHIISHYGKDKNTLILFDHIEFGKEYFNYMKAFFPEKIFYWIEGTVKAEEREDIRLSANIEDNVLLFGSLGTTSTGINIPKIHNIIFLFIGKSSIKIKQSIGRGLRLHESKDKLLVFDIADNLKYSKGHLAERLKLYTVEKYPVEIYEIGDKK